MNWEAVAVDEALCNSCGTCVELCPLDNLRLGDNGIPFVKYDQCWYCETCELECPTGAIRVVMPYLVR